MQRIERRHSKPDDNEIKWLDIYLMTCGNSSVGRARPCQGRGREFESRFPLQIKDMRSSGCQFEKFYGALAKRLCSGLQIRLVRFDSGTRLHFLPWPDGGIGRHKGFKIPRRSRCVGSSPTPGTMGKQRIIKAISSVVKPPTGGFFVFVLSLHHCFAIRLRHWKRALLPPDHRNYRNLAIVPGCL